MTMIMTVADAKTHLCPFSSDDGMCVANLCMAWRWCVGEYWAEQTCRTHNFMGYCGLAGSPFMGCKSNE